MARYTNFPDTLNLEDLRFLARRCISMLNDDMYALLLFSGFDVNWEKVSFWEA